MTQNRQPPLMTKALQGTEALPFIQVVLASQNYQNFKLRTQQAFPGILTPQEEAIEVLTISSGQDQMTLTCIPFVGGAGNSSYTALFQSDSRTISESRSCLFTLNQDQTITAVVERNETAELNAVLAPAGTFQKGILVTRDGQKVTLDGLTAEQVHSRMNTLTKQPAVSRRNFVSCL